MVACFLLSRYFISRFAEESRKRDDDAHDKVDDNIQSDASALEGIKSSTVDILRKAFNLLDTDHSGFIELAVYILATACSHVVFLHTTKCCMH